MATGDPSSPIRWGQGQHVSDTRNLFLKVFQGEIYTAFHQATIFSDGKMQVKFPVRGSKAVQFLKVWKNTSEYHTPGTELLGTNIPTTEVTVTVDDILVSHFAVSDLDEMLTQASLRGQFAAESGMALAQAFDKNVARSIILAARAPADGPFPSGNVITDAALTRTGAIDGKAWIDAIITAQETLFGKNVPDTQPRYMAVNLSVFNAIKWATDANGRYLVLDRDLSGPQAGGVAGVGRSLNIEGVTVMATQNLPTTDETSNTSVYSKYRANYSTTTGILWTPYAVGTGMVKEIGVESTRDTRRLEDFQVASMLAGHGTLRPECAVEFKTA